MGVRWGPAQEPQLGPPVRHHAELSGHRGGDERRRGVPLALRADVLPGAAEGRLGAGAGHRPGGRPGRVAVAPLVHRRDRRSNAARPEPPRRHSLVPVPEHVLLPDLRPVQRSAPEAGSGPTVADRPPPRRAARLRARPQRPPPGDRGGPRGQAVGRDVDRGARWQRGSRRAARGRLTPARGQGEDDRCPAPGRSHEGWGGGQDQGRLRARDPSGRGVGAGCSGLAPRRSGCDAAPRRRLHLLVRADPVPGLPVRHELAAGPRQYVEQPGSRPEVDPAVRQGRRVRRPQRHLRDPALLDDGRQLVRARPW